MLPFLSLILLLGWGAGAVPGAVRGAQEGTPAGLDDGRVNESMERIEEGIAGRFTPGYEEAMMAYYRGDLYRAKEKYRELLEGDPTSIRLHRDLAVIHRELGQYAESSGYYERLLEMELPARKRYEITSELGWVQYLLGRPDRALETLLAAAEMDGGAEDPELLFRLGLVSSRLDRPERAEDYLRRTLELVPGHAHACYELGRILMHRGRTKEAIHYFQRTLVYDRGFRDVHRLLARLYMEEGRTVEAYDSLIRATRVAPHDLDLRERLEEIRRQIPDVIAMRREIRDLEREKMDVEGVEPFPLPGDEQRQMRILLIGNADSLRFITGPGYSLTDGETGEELKAPGGRREWRVESSGGKTVLSLMDAAACEVESTVELEVAEEFSARSFHLKPTDPGSLFMLFDMHYGEGYFWAGEEDRRYRGEMIIRPDEEGRLMVINELGLETYLASLVPSEMPASWPMEALKAQAVAARSYVVNRALRREGEVYHLRGSVIDAAYRGYDSEHERSTQAVVETAGEAVFHEGRVIEAVFSANSGGYVESSRDVWGGELPYLQSFPERQEGERDSFPLPPGELMEWIGSWQESYSAPAPYGSAQAYRWTRVVSREELESVVHREHDIGPIRRLVITGRGKGGSVQGVYMEGERGGHTVSGDYIRGQLGDLRSNRFFIETEYDTDGLPLRFYFRGSGWGHAVGMSQTGAANMAHEGWQYREILNFYYPNTEVRRLP